MQEPTPQNTRVQRMPTHVVASNLRSLDGVAKPLVLVEEQHHRGQNMGSFVDTMDTRNIDVRSQSEMCVHKAVP